MRRLTALFAGMFASLAAQAQFVPAGDSPLDEEAPEEIRRYTVEVILFAYNEDVSVGTEVFVPKRIEPEPLGDDEDMLPADELPSEPEPVVEDDLRPVSPFELQMLGRDELTLTDTHGRLERLEAYEPLMHFGWTQTTIAKELTPTLPLARFGRVPSGLEGTLQLYLSRFLHLFVEVSLAAPEDSSASDFARFDDRVAVHADQRQRENYGVDSYAPLRYRIVEDRIMKNGETRYYDHPKFGVIAKVVRVEEAGAETDVDADSAGPVLR